MYNALGTTQSIMFVFGDALIYFRSAEFGTSLHSIFEATILSSAVSLLTSPIHSAMRRIKRAIAALLDIDSPPPPSENSQPNATSTPPVAPATPAPPRPTYSRISRSLWEISTLVSMDRTLSLRKSPWCSSKGTRRHPLKGSLPLVLSNPLPLLKQIYLPPQLQETVIRTQ